MVFVHATGDTHALGVEASAVLAAMRSQPDAGYTGAQWLDVAGYETAAPDEAAAEQLMIHLETLGLVRHLPP